MEKNTGVMERKQEKCGRIGLLLFLVLLKKVGSESAGDRFLAICVGAEKECCGPECGQSFFK